MTAVGFKLGFTGASRTDTAARTALTGERCSLSGKARRGIFELCDLDLQFAFAGNGMLGKNIENQHGTIDKAHVFIRVAFKRPIQDFLKVFYL